MSINYIREFIFGNYYKRIGFSKEDSYYSMKLIEKVPDPRNAKEHYELFLREKSRKSVKQLELITYKPTITYTKPLTLLI